MSAPEPKEEVNIFNPVNYGVKPDGTIEFAPLYSPHFSGNPTAPTPVVDNSSNRIATTSYVKRQGYVTDGDIGGTYAPLASPDFTGIPTAPTAAPATNTTQIATTAYVQTSYAPKASPVLAGTPTTPVPPLGSNSLQIANTQWIRSEFYDQIQILSFLSAKANLASPQLTGTPTINNDNVATENYVTNQGYLTITDAGTTYAPIDNASFTGTSTFTKAKVSTRFLLMRATLASTDALLGSSAITAGNYLTTLNPGSVSSYALQQFTAGDSGSQSIIITSGGSFGQTKNTIQSYDSRRDSPLNLYLNPLGGNVHAPTEASTVNDTRIATTAYVKNQGYLTSTPFTPFFFNYSGTFTASAASGGPTISFNIPSIPSNYGLASITLRIHAEMQWDVQEVFHLGHANQYYNAYSRGVYIMTIFPGRMPSSGSWAGVSTNICRYLQNSGGSNTNLENPYVVSNSVAAIYRIENIYQVGSTVSNNGLIVGNARTIQFATSSPGYSGLFNIQIEVLTVDQIFNNIGMSMSVSGESDLNVH